MDYQIENIIQGDCLEIARQFPNNYINLIATSPPYAQQRQNQYGGIPEADYPAWTVKWADAFKHALTDDGSIAIVIRPHIRQGQISDYVLRTRLAMREAGWIECEELIWIKPDSPPLGHIQRPRRAWESILWFSKSGRPFCDPKANGTPSDRVGFESKKGVGDYKNGVCESKSGIARCRDYVEAGTGGVDKRAENTHPAQYPVKLAAWIIRLLCPAGGVVVDPFMGSGTTGVACRNLGMVFHGIEISPEYCEIAAGRMGLDQKEKPSPDGPDHPFFTLVE